jgi:hypothetical protein
MTDSRGFRAAEGLAADRAIFKRDILSLDGYYVVFIFMLI